MDYINYVVASNASYLLAGSVAFLCAIAKEFITAKTTEVQFCIIVAAYSGIVAIVFTAIAFDLMHRIGYEPNIFTFVGLPGAIAIAGKDQNERAIKKTLSYVTNKLAEVAEEEVANSIKEKEVGGINGGIKKDISDKGNPS